MEFGFNILFLVIIAASVLGCFLLGDERSQRFMVGSIIGILLATQFTPLVTGPLSSLSSFFTPTVISLVLLTTSLIIAVMARRTKDSKWKKNRFRGIISGFLTSFFIIGYVISFLPDSTRDKLITDYNLAAITYDLRIYSLVVVCVWLLATFIMVGKVKN